VIGLSAGRDGFFHIHGFERIRIVRLTLDSGPWLAFGKVTIVNSDSDPQNAHVWLRLAGDDVDETRVRIDEEDSDEPNVQAASVQAGFVVEEGRVPLDLVCATHSGGTEMAKLSAIKLDQLNPDL
jgi:hypothetical protein